MPKFNRLHYNFVAKRIREIFPMGDTEEDRVYGTVERVTLSKLAINFAKAFQKDDPDFDAVKFLNACSPDTGVYPLGDLWEE
jgi:hypothetical protein